MTRTVLLFASFLIASCSTTLVGNGEVQTEQREVDAFTAISATTVADTAVSLGAEFGVSVTCDSNLLVHLETTVRGDTLNIEQPAGTILQPRADCAVDVVLPAVTALSNLGTATMVADDVLVGTTRLENSGAEANLRVAGATGDEPLTVLNSGTGDVAIEGIDVPRLTAINSGTGRMTLSGEAPDASYDNSGSGDIDAEAMAAERVEITNTGDGDVEVHATVTATGSISGSGNVIVSGGASTDFAFSGSGRVTVR